MSTADYTSIPSTGKLKLKGVKDSKITKRKKNKPSKDDKPAEDVEDNSVMLRKLADEDREMESEDKMTEQEGAGSLAKDEDRDGDLGSTVKTEAERRYEEQRKKRLYDRLKREGIKTHKQRVEELNRYLSGLSEHHDMPRIGPG